MRILHIVTLVSPEGELGGPLRVAVNQLRQMQAMGHEVLMVAAARGFEGPLPSECQGVPVKLFPAVQAVPGTGFAGVSAPGMVPWLLKYAAAADAVHVHFARDLVHVPAVAALLALKVPFVAQTHGMIIPSRKKMAWALDALIIRRALRTATTVWALTETERQELLAVEPRGNYGILPNGIPLDAAAPRADPGASREVLFLARMAPRKRPAVLARAAALLAEEFPEWSFSFVGPDEGEGAAVQTQLEKIPALKGRGRWEGPVEPGQTLARMARAAVYVLPAEKEPFGMTIIEAQLAGLPVVVREDCGLAQEVASSDAGAVFSGDEEGLAKALAPLMQDAELRVRQGRNGQRYVAEHFGIIPVINKLLASY